MSNISEIELNDDVDAEFSREGISIGTITDNGDMSYRAGLSEHGKPELFSRYTDDNLFADAGFIELEAGDYRLNSGMTFNNDIFGIDSFDQTGVGARVNTTPDLIPDINSEFSANAGVTLDGNPVAYTQAAFEADEFRGSEWDVFVEAGAGYDPTAGARADVMAGAQREFTNDSGAVDARFTTGVEGTLQNESGARISAEYDRRLNVTGLSEGSNLSAVFRGEAYHMEGSWGAIANAALLKDISVGGFDFRTGPEVTYDTADNETTAGITMRAPF